MTTTKSYLLRLADTHTMSALKAEQQHYFWSALMMGTVGFGFFVLAIAFHPLLSLPAVVALVACGYSVYIHAHVKKQCETAIEKLTQNNY